MIDLSAVESALIGTLAADPELAALVPDGVFWDLARQGAERFVVVSLSTSRAAPELDDGEAFRAVTYLVKAVAKGSDADPIRAADARIHALLHHGTLDLTAAGGELMVLHWVERVRYTERVESDVWQHRGARYELVVTPN